MTVAIANDRERAVVLDHYSRKPIDVRVFRSNPTADEMAELLDGAVRRAGTAPRHIISDKGSQFWHADEPSEAYGALCQCRGVKPRFGAVGNKGSLAVLERFWRSMKEECTRRILVPFGINATYFEIGAYIRWYSTVRPHAGLGGATLSEVYSGAVSGDAIRFETRPRYPIPEGRGSPEVERVNHLKLRVTYLGGMPASAVHRVRSRGLRLGFRRAESIENRWQSCVQKWGFAGCTRAVEPRECSPRRWPVAAQLCCAVRMSLCGRNTVHLSRWKPGGRVYLVTMYL